MSPQNSLAAQQLRHLIYYHLDNDFAHNALFLAGRLQGLDSRSAESVHLLAMCHLRVGQYKAAYDYSKEKAVRGHHLGCAYVFAQACLGLGRFRDGILALERCRGLWAARNHWNKHSASHRQNVPDAAAVLSLLGRLHRGNRDTKKSVDCYVEALKLNPFMWNAFVDLCDTGVTLNPGNVFVATPDILSEPLSSDVASNQSILAPQLTSTHAVTPTTDPFNPVSRTAGDPGLNYGGTNLLSRLNGLVKEPRPRHAASWETPTANGSQEDDDTMMGEVHSMQQSDIMNGQQRKDKTLSQEHTLDSARPMTTRSRMKASDDVSEDGRSVSSLAVKRTVSGRAPSSTAVAPGDAPARRSNRLLNHFSSTSSKLGLTSKDSEARLQRDVRKAKAPSVRVGKTTASTVGRVVSGNRKMDPSNRDAKESCKPMTAAPQAALREISKRVPPTSHDVPTEREALQSLLEMMAKIGEAYYRLSRYEGLKAQHALQALPASQKVTPWVMAQMGRAQYEQAAYADASENFAKLKKMEPSRTEDMEIYSTVLWHLKNQMELAYLSHELIEIDRLSPQSWCAIGNSFSLEREHEQAIKCFRRATQLDPKFAYAYTLQGHEHIASEELDKAQHAYRSAISADNRHYNGWYGLGQCYEKLGKYEMAEKHYKCAAQINPGNTVLAVCIGRVLEKMQNYPAALSYYGKAAPSDKNARFMKARVLLRVRRFAEALTELEELKSVAPDEATVHYMLGKLYKLTNRRALAIRHLTIALNLDPKAAPHIKEALETLEQTSDNEDDDEDFA